MPNWDDEGFYQSSFAIDKSRRYHAKMQAFYQSWSDLTNILVALAGLGAFLALFGGKDSILAQCFVAAVTVLSTIGSKLAPAKKARLHADLSRRFTDLAGNIAMMDANANNLKKAKAARLRIEKDEPPVRRLIDFVARNEELRARGRPESEIAPLSRWQKTFGYCATFGMDSIDAWIAKRPADKEGSSE